MADNYQVLDAVGSTITISAKDLGAGVYSANVGLRDYPKGQALMANSLPVAVASDQPQVNTPLEATGTLGALNDAVTLDLKNMPAAGVHILAGTFVGALNFECGLDGTNWRTTVYNDVAGSALSGNPNITLTNANLPFVGSPFYTGYRYVRVRVSAYTSGSTTAFLCAKPSVFTSFLVTTAVTTDNATFTDGTSRVVPAGFIFDEVAGTALTENDGAAARIDDKRAQIIVGEDAATRGRRWTIDAQGALSVKEKRAATPTQTSVAASASSVTVIASNANRLGATVYNDSTVDLYLKLGATASTTSFTVKMAAASYYEVPFGYTGIIDGIWASATGNARITELAA